MVTLAAAADNHAIGKRMTTGQFLAAEHVHIPFLDSIEPAFARLGTKRKFVLSTDNLLPVLFLVARSKRVAVIPSTVPRIYSALYRTKMDQPPVPTPPWIIDLIYPERKGRRASMVASCDQPACN